MCQEIDGDFVVWESRCVWSWCVWVKLIVRHTAVLLQLQRHDGLIQEHQTVSNLRRQTIQTIITLCGERDRERESVFMQLSFGNTVIEKIIQVNFLQFK